MISSLHLQHFSKYRCSSRQCSLFYYSNIVLLSAFSNPSIRFFSETSKGSYHYRQDFHRFEFSQSSSLSLQVLVLFHFLPFFFPYSYISWYSSIEDYTYPFSVCSNSFFLQRSQWTFFATFPCLILYSF